MNHHPPPHDDCSGTSFVVHDLSMLRNDSWSYNGGGLLVGDNKLLPLRRTNRSSSNNNNNNHRPFLSPGKATPGFSSSGASIINHTFPTMPDMVMPMPSSSVTTSRNTLHSLFSPLVLEPTPIASRNRMTIVHDRQVDVSESSGLANLLLLAGKEDEDDGGHHAYSTTSSCLSALLVLLKCQEDAPTAAHRHRHQRQDLHQELLLLQTQPVVHQQQQQRRPAFVSSDDLPRQHHHQQQHNNKNNKSKNHTTTAITATTPRKLSSSLPGASSLLLRNISSASVNNNRETHLEKWSQRFHDLVAFRNSFGHCLVPLEYPTNPPLAHWVKRQRCQYKTKMEGRHSTLLPERQAALEDMGFIWDSHKATWEERLQEMRQFQETHGHSNIPRTKYLKNPQLSIWVKCQRRQYKLFLQNKKSNMTIERAQRLSDIGFDWAPRQRKLIQTTTTTTTTATTTTPMSSSSSFGSSTFASSSSCR